MAVVVRRPNSGFAALAGNIFERRLAVVEP